jgi:hypothetical protein
MSWGDERWRQAAREYHAARKYGRHQGITHMDLETEKTDAEIIPFSRHHEQEEIRPPAFSDDALALALSTSTRIRCAMSPVWENGSAGMASVGASTRD